MHYWYDWRMMIRWMMIEESLQEKETMRIIWFQNMLLWCFLQTMMMTTRRNDVQMNHHEDDTCQNKRVVDHNHCWVGDHLETREKQTFRSCPMKKKRQCSYHCRKTTVVQQIMVHAHWVWMWDKHARLHHRSFGKAVWDDFDGNMEF